MSKLRSFAILFVALALVSTGAYAATEPQASSAAKRAQAQKPTLQLDLEAAARQAAQQEQEQSGSGGAIGAGEGLGGAAPADPSDDDVDYLAEVQAIRGKKMTVSFTNAPPVIDGNLNDPEWNFAESVTDFVQREPDNGQPGSERTEVRMLYDKEAIYLAFWLYDREPDRIIALDLRRDSRLNTDDTIAVQLDTYHDRRNAYLFRVNPLGTKYDAEVRNERNVNSDWDERWDAVARITDEGWVAEMRIPLRALRFNTGSHVWGIDFKREIRRKNEEVTWSNYRRGFQFNNISQAGNLVGLEDLGLTQRFRFQPYVTGSGSQYNVTDDPYNDADGNIGIEDFKVQITPNLTADLTVNTDFAQVEDDNERVNLTRFPLFFPEKREFFLESASNFQFGSSGGGRGGFGEGPAVNLYHSRNIGLVGGEPVPIIYGAKLTGKVGNTNIGFINAQTGDSDLLEDGTELPVYPGQNYTVLRLKQDIFERSTVGMIYTNSQGNGARNRVAGVDASFRFYDYLSFSGEIASVVDDSRLEDSDLDDHPLTGRFYAGWNSDQFNVSGSYQRVDPDFETDLGFIRRRDMAEQKYRAGWNPRPEFLPAVRQFRFSGNYEYLTDVDGRLLSEGQNISATTNFQSGDRVTFSYYQNFERLDRRFYVSFSENVYVDPGDYQTDGWWFNFDTFDGRRVGGRFSISKSGYWDGTKDSISPGGTFRFNENFTLSPSYSYNDVQLPTGEFITHVITTRVTYNFNERWLTNSLVQYNSVSGRASVYLRLRYVINEIDSFYLVYKSSRLWDEVYDGIADHQLIAKVTYSLDF